jgi:hypothetical protein
MIATVTWNPAIGKSVTVRGFEIGEINLKEVASVLLPFCASNLTSTRALA